jgi:hypothetical protein
MPLVDRAGVFTTVDGAPATIRTAKSGAVSVAFKFTLDELIDNDGDVHPWQGYDQFIYHDIYFINRNGQMIDRALDTLKNVLHWDGDVEAIARYRAPAVKLTIEEETYEGVVRLKVKWVNPLVGGGGFKAPDLNAVKALATQYGGQLRAVFGAQPQQQRPAAKPAPRQSAPPAEAPADPPPDDQPPQCDENGIPF